MTKLWTPIVLILASAPSVRPASAQQSPQFDSETFADHATAILVARARSRHTERTRALAGYQANTFTRVEGRMGVSRFAPGLTVFAYETAARVQWAYPGNVKVNVKGARMFAPRIPGMSTPGQVTAFWEDLFGHEPWFVPGAMGDRIQLMGIPDEEAIHPLAPGAEALYTYALTDSVELVLPNRTVRAVAVHVQPRYPYARTPGWPDHSEPTLVSGEMWLDADSLDVVRLSVAFVGSRIWDDDPDSPELVSLAAELEYGLHEEKYWLPLRQILNAEFVYRYLPGIKLPGSAVTTFSDFTLDEVETDFAFSSELTPGTSYRTYGSWNCPEAWEFDSGRRDDCGRSTVTRLIRNETSGTTWEITLPPRDSLLQFDFGGEFAYTSDLAGEHFLNERLGALARISEQAPDIHTRLTADWIQVYEAFGFNRVQGPSLGFGYAWDTGIDFTTIHASGRFGFGDERPMGQLTWKRESPRGRFEASIFRDMNTVEPRVVGAGVGGAMRTLLMGRDEADYYMAGGGQFSYVGYAGALKGVRFGMAFERQQSVERVAGSWLNDFLLGSGTFPQNPSIADGDFARLFVASESRIGPVNVVLGSDGVASRSSIGGRVWAETDVWFTNGHKLIGQFRTRAGVAGGDSLPQLAFRVGGRNSVRGHDYGFRTGTTFWAGQLDLEWVVNDWWSPVAFMDIGNAGGIRDPLLGVGAGVSFLSGLVRLDFSKAMNPSRPVIFDLLFQIPHL